MTQMLDRLSMSVNRVTEWFLAPLLAFLAGLLVVAVFSRYVFHIAMVEAIELTRLAFVWGCFLGAAVALRRGAHVRVTFLVDRLPTRLHPLGLLVAYSSFIVFAGMMVWHGAELTRRMSVTSFPTLGISQAWLYAALPVSGAIMVLHGAAGLVRTAKDLAAAIRGRAP